MDIPFRRFGVMIDCSRNAVMNRDAFSAWRISYPALGYNAIRLYTEDTYEVEGEPYFGYLRGRYSGAELKEMDAYAGRTRHRADSLYPRRSRIWARFSAMRSTPPSAISRIFCWWEKSARTG